MALVNITAGDLFVPFEIQENDIYNGISHILKTIRPTWSPDKIKYKLFTDGITNKLVACQLSDCDNEKDIVLVRIYGNKTDLLIDRTAEIRNIRLLNSVGLAPKIYGLFLNGLVYQYCPGVTINPESVVDIEVWPKIARKMAKMHRVELGKEIAKTPMVWDKIEQFLNLLPEKFCTEEKQNRFVNSFGSLTRLRIEFERLKSHLTKNESPIVFAHNDLLLGNVIYNRDEGTICFIDFEYASYNYQAYDLANHFNEFVGLNIDDIDYGNYPSKEFQTAWIKEYLKEFRKVDSPANSDIEKVYLEVQQMALASHYLWGIWSLVQFELSDIDFDFGRYAEIRLNRYFELKDQVFKDI